MPVLLRVLGVLTLVLMAGCGSSPAPTTPIAPLDPLRAPPLPAAWKHVVDGRLSFGVPPGWHATPRAGVVQVRSADRALALTVALDERAGSASTAAYAAATLKALAGYTGLRGGGARPIVDAQYPASTVSGVGTLRSTGVRQRVVAIALMPSPGSICSLLAFSSARVSRSRYASTLTALVRTIYVVPRSGRSG
jgi:hypothetical protein